MMRAGGGGASGQESPTGGEQAAHLLLPAAPAQSRTSDTTPALSDAGTPVSGGVHLTCISVLI